MIFPTHVGVYLHKPKQRHQHQYLPHACGGVPSITMEDCWETYIFPTHVVVYPATAYILTMTENLPHACGGVPELCILRKGHEIISPRMWGCTSSMRNPAGFSFIFPTHVGVYPLNTLWNTIYSYLPHACGGVPVFMVSPDYLLGSSPRTWGCTLEKDYEIFGQEIFPTHVGFEPERVLFLYIHILRHN